VKFVRKNQQHLTIRKRGYAIIVTMYVEQMINLIGG
jgi:hypothetical protein